MPHLDDGILHAHLDGALDALAAADALPDGMQASDVLAHLEHCPDCRARLDQERTVRDRAGTVLRDAAPHALETPPFTAAGAPPAPRRRTYLPYAWAASLLLAVGAGWWGSQISRDPRASAPEGRAQEAERAPDIIQIPPPPAAFDAGTPDGTLGTADNGTTSVASGSARAGREAPHADAEPRAERAEAAGATPSRDAATPVPSREPAPGAVPTAPLREQRRDAPPAAPAIRPSVSPLPLAEAERRATAEAPPPPAIPGAVLEFLARDSAGLVQWRAVSDEQHIDSTSFVLADADVLGREIAREPGTSAVRLRQRLGTGEEVTVMTWHAERLAQAANAVRDAVLDSGAGREAAAAGKAGQGAAVAPVRAPRRLPDSRHEAVFTAAEGEAFVVVRAPSWLSPADIASRLRRAPH